MLEKLIKWFISLFNKKEVQPTQNEDDNEYVNEPIEDNGYTEPHDSFENTTNEEMTDYSNVMVHIDAGHASCTPGKRSPYAMHKILPELDFYEYKFNREVTDILAEKLTLAGFQVHIVTPEVDTDIKLSTRAGRANKKKLENPNLHHIFISIHANAHGNGSAWTSAHGWSAWTTKGQNNSDKLAECLYEAADEILPEYNISSRGDKSDGDRDYEENFTVIYVANMPAVLTENCFYTNIKDTEFLMSNQGKEAIADIHLNGIKKFVDKYYNK